MQESDADLVMPTAERPWCERQLAEMVRKYVDSSRHRSNGCNI